MAGIHVVNGAGQVGTNIAEQLAAQGHQVRILTRSGSGPEHALIERRKTDVSKADQLAAAFDGAVAVYHGIHGSAYTAKAWRAELPAAEQAVLEAAGRVGAVVVFPESLYSYGHVDGPITEDTPRNATKGKLGIRTELLRGREESATNTVSVAASDFFGPHVMMSHAGERMIPTVLAGKTMRVIGSLDMLHSFTYVPDLASAMIAAATNPELWNGFYHAPTAPAVTQRELIEAVARAGDVPTPKMSAIPAWVLHVGGVVSTDSRELAETSYQFSKPFVVDSSRSEAVLGVSPTPFDTAIKQTVEWWRARQA
ncbi:NAD-dependent epimerase/dehydratase family protein [Antrihabitans sp. NCIMB 15449]|uniref:NAD-dependent epimerase/dehydratase family protein n=1 Tax=Antrihabitans spumae TaxID=3373370 RepID=A0ABW7JPC2_9NOCA